MSDSVERVRNVKISFKNAYSVRDKHRGVSKRLQNSNVVF